MYAGILANCTGRYEAGIHNPEVAPLIVCIQNFFFVAKKNLEADLILHYTVQTFQ